MPFAPAAQAMLSIKTRSRASKILKRAFLWLAFLAMAVAVQKSWDFLAGVWATVSWRNFSIAVALWATSHFVLPAFAMLVLGQERHARYGEVLAVHALRLPAKYLPGGIWHMVGRVADFYDLGYSRQALARFVLLENLVAAAFSLGLGSALLVASTETRWEPVFAGIAIVSLVGILVTPWVVSIVTRSPKRLPWVRYGGILAVTFAFWTLASASFVCFLRGFGLVIQDAGLLATVGTYLFSWGAGFIAFFAPQGVGIFEFVAAALLADRLDLAQAVALLASFRLVVLAGDLSAWTVALAIFRRMTVR